MSDAIDEEREKIRERKKRELQERLEEGGQSSPPDSDEGAPSEPIHIDGQEHFQRVVDSHDTVLVDCYADWCGPCEMLEPTVEALAAETEAAVAKVDVDRHQGIAQQLGARSIPTLVLYSDGEPVERQMGVQQKPALKSLIQRYT
jgi:thioredoxin 1